MSNWSNEIEQELTILIKDWLKQTGKTQAELSQNLNATSTRMSSILDVLKTEFQLGGIQRIANRLCQIELLWSKSNQFVPNQQNDSDPFGQLDLLLEEIKEDCDSE